MQMQPQTSCTSRHPAMALPLLPALASSSHLLTLTQGLEPSDAAIKQEQQNGAVHPATDAAAAPSREDWEESDEEFGEENVGQWSPQPVAAAEIRGLEVVSQAQDERMLQLLRTQVGPAELSASACHWCVLMGLLKDGLRHEHSGGPWTADAELQPSLMWVWVWQCCKCANGTPLRKPVPVDLDSLHSTGALRPGRSMVCSHWPHLPSRIVTSSQLMTPTQAVIAALHQSLTPLTLRLILTLTLC